MARFKAREDAQALVDHEREETAPAFFRDATDVGRQEDVLQVHQG